MKCKFHRQLQPLIYKDWGRFFTQEYENGRSHRATDAAMGHIRARAVGPHDSSKCAEQAAARDSTAWRRMQVFYREAAAALVVFDVASSHSFEEVAQWKRDIDNKICLENGEPIPAYLIANKVCQSHFITFPVAYVTVDADWFALCKRRLESICYGQFLQGAWVYHVVRDLARNVSLMLMTVCSRFQTSAKEGVGLTEVFDTLSRKLIENEQILMALQPQGKQESITLTLEPSRQKSCFSSCWGGVHATVTAYVN